MRRHLKTGLSVLGGRSPADGLTALIYHRVGGGSPDERDVATADFADHVRLLRDAPVLPLGDAVDRLDGGDTRPSVVLTFDDGFVNWLTDLLPVLEQERVPASLYLCPGLWGGQHADVAGAPGRLLDRAQAAEVAASPWVELGSHAMTHRDLRRLDDRTGLRDADGVDRDRGSRGRRWRQPTRCRGDHLRWRGGDVVRPCLCQRARSPSDRSPPFGR